LDDLTEQAKVNPKLRRHYDLRTDLDDLSQRMLNAIEPRSFIHLHRHTRSTETVCVIRGAVKQSFYEEVPGETNADGTPVLVKKKEFVVRADSRCPVYVIPKNEWHTLESIESGTIIFESKDGQFGKDGSESVDEKEMKKKNTIYLCLAHMSEAGLEQKYIKEAFDTNWVVPLGPNVDAFEKGLEEFVGEGKSVVALSSGTAAVHMALLASGVGPGDEVLVQSFTFCASVNPVTYVGATPVFIDSEKNSWNIDLDLLEKAIIDRKAKTGKYPKAIIPVALFGMPYDCDRLMAIADKYGITVIEDSAEGFGSTWKGRVLGTFGHFGVLSFNGNKMITTSGGGALVCPDQESAEKVLWYATQARDAYPYYQHSEIGFNYRMSNICAGIGRGQLTVVNDHLAHHRHVQALYHELFKDVQGVTLHEAPSADYGSNFWLCTITLDPDVKIVGQENAYKEIVKGAVGGAAGVTRMVDVPTTDCQTNDNVEALRVYLNDTCNIQSRPLWKPMHKQPVFSGCDAYVTGVAEDIFRRGMCLPAGPCVTDEDVKYIVESIKEAIVK